MKQMIPLAFLGLASLALGGCTGAILTGAAATGIAVAEERSVGDVIDDTVIQARVNAKMAEADDNLNLFLDVNLTIVEGIVYLTGTTDSQADKDKAYKIAYSVEGVRNVVNELIVDPEGAISGLAKDSWITAQLRGKVLADGKIRDINFTFDTVNKIVFLMGIARDQEEMDRLVFHARSISGVVKVINHVKIGARGA